MATVHAYLATMQSLELQLGQTLGTDLTALPKDIRVAVTAATAMVAVVCKALTDSGVLTDVQLQAAVTAAQGESWPNLPV